MVAIASLAYDVANRTLIIRSPGGRSTRTGHRRGPAGFITEKLTPHVGEFGQHLSIAESRNVDAN
jgi:hypothetical protein